MQAAEAPGADVDGFDAGESREMDHRCGAGEPRPDDPSGIADRPVGSCDDHQIDERKHPESRWFDTELIGYTSGRAGNDRSQPVPGRNGSQRNGAACPAGTDDGEFERLGFRHSPEQRSEEMKWSFRVHRS
jgi:hypothetical protein